MCDVWQAKNLFEWYSMCMKLSYFKRMWKFARSYMLNNSISNISHNYHKKACASNDYKIYGTPKQTLFVDNYVFILIIFPFPAHSVSVSLFFKFRFFLTCSNFVFLPSFSLFLPLSFSQAASPEISHSLSVNPRKSRWLWQPRLQKQL